MIKSEMITYHDQETELEAFVAYPSDSNKRFPLVILCHAWAGRDAFIMEKAEMIARSGYGAFALDMYGKGILGKSKEENAALKAPFMQDRSLMQWRVARGFDVACALPYFDARHTVVIGFGFGGVCALDLARSGADIRGAVSIYGHLMPPPAELMRPIKAKILVLHGYNDRIVPPEEVAAFEKEMDAAKIDWQINMYGNTMHAFATPSANAPEAGLLYNPLSAARAWAATESFLKEVINN